MDAVVAALVFSATRSSYEKSCEALQGIWTSSFKVSFRFSNSFYRFNNIYVSQCWSTAVASRVVTNLNNQNMESYLTKILLELIDSGKELSSINKRDETPYSQWASLVTGVRKISRLSIKSVEADHISPKAATTRNNRLQGSTIIMIHLRLAILLQTVPFAPYNMNEEINRVAIEDQTNPQLSWESQLTEIVNKKRVLASDPPMKGWHVFQDRLSSYHYEV